MSYAMRPIGYLMGLGEAAGDTPEQIVLRNQAKANVASMRSEALRLTQSLRDIVEAERYNRSAFDRGIRRILDAARAAGGRLGMDINIPIPKVEMASMIQNALAKLGSLATKAEQLSYAPNITDVYPVIDEINRVARLIISKTDEMVRNAQPQRKEVDPSKNAASGLGFVMVLPWVVIGIFLVAGAVALGFVEALEEGDRAEQRARDVTREICNRMRSSGEECDPQQFMQIYEQALRAQGNVGMARVVSEIGETTRSVAEAAQGPLEQFMEKIGIGGGIAIAVAGTAVVGLGLYAAWPYLTGVRRVGKRFAGE